VSTAGYAANGITSYSVLGTSTITIDKVTTAGERSGGVRARGGTGATVIANVVETHGYGIDAGAVTGTVLVKVNEVTTTGSAYAEGIQLVSIFGSGRIESGTISTIGKNSSGIGLLLGGQPGYAGDAVVISGSIATQGENSDGIRGEAYVGSLTIESGSITTAGYEADGIDALAGGNVTIASEAIATSGIISDGIRAVSQLSPFGGEPGSVSIASESVSVSGDSSRGIVGLAEGDVTIVSGAVATSGGTAIVESLELVCDDETGYCNYETVRRPGPRPVGILAKSNRGSVTITSGSVTTRGRGAHGIHAITEAGAITIASGDISVLGGNASAIRAESYSGDIAVTIDGDVSAARAPAVEATTGGGVRVTVANGGLLRSSGDQFALVANAASADVQVAAGGTLAGSVSLTGGADTLTVAGLFDARGESRFGDGADLLTNEGTLAVRSGTVRFAGLERFRNAGLITLADGSADDVLDLTGTAFEGAAGSAVRFDVVTGAGGAAAADQLILGDVSGVTEVQVALQGPATLGTRADLITVSGDSPDGAFVLDPAFGDAGFLRYRLVGVGTGTIALATAPDREIFEAGRIAPAAANLWRHGAEAWAAQRLAARDSGEAGRGVWGQAFTGGQTVEDLGYGTSFDGETYGETLSTKEKYSGLQFGGDLIGGPVRLGVTAGYGDADLRLRESGNEIKAKGFNVGVYGGWSNRLLFVDLLGKIDFADIEFDARSAGARRDFDATIYGLRADAGLRLGGETFFAEPMVSLAWTNASIDDFEVDQGEFRLGGGSGLLGQAGLRAGGRWALGGGYALSPSGGLFAVKELAGGNGLGFHSGTASLAIEGDRPGLYARAEGGLTLSSGSGWDFSLRGQGDFGGDVSGAAVRAGFNWRW
ncbi:MAG TPA: autotransporter outer membrane beta-barrel domain-containing protein, partial [Allosphingosinicella sp.]